MIDANDRSVYHTPHLCEISEIMFQIADAWIGSEHQGNHEIIGYELQVDRAGRRRAGKRRCTENQRRSKHGRGIVPVLVGVCRRHAPYHLESAIRRPKCVSERCWDREQAQRTTAPPSNSQ